MNVVSVIVRAIDQTGGGLGAAQAQLQRFVSEAMRAQTVAAGVGAGASQNIDDMTGSLGRNTAASGAARSAWLLAAAAVTAWVTASIEASAAWQRTESVMTQATGNVNLAAEEMIWLRGVSDDLGLSLTTTSAGFGQLAAAARGTALEGAASREIFLGIAQASAALKLTTDQTEGSLRAIQQMISKGTVQAEELRGQLGERLPGAFQIAARAMDVTTQELGKMLEKGEVVAADFLPKLAIELQKTFGTQAQANAASFQAAMNRAGNTLGDLKRAFGDELLPVVTALASAFAGMGGAADGLAGIAKLLALALGGVGVVALVVIESFATIIHIAGSSAAVITSLAEAAGAAVQATRAALSGDAAAAEKFASEARGHAAAAGEAWDGLFVKIYEGWADTSKKVSAIGDGMVGGPPKGYDPKAAAFARQEAEVAALEKQNEAMAAANAKMAADLEKDKAKAAEKAAKEQERIDAAMSKAFQSRVERDLDLFKSSQVLERSLLEQSYADKEISLEDYWKRRKEIAVAGHDAELIAANAKLAAADADQSANDEQYAMDPDQPGLMEKMIADQTAFEDAQAQIAQLEMAKLASISTIDQAASLAAEKRDEELRRQYEREEEARLAWEERKAEIDADTQQQKQAMEYDLAVDNVDNPNSVEGRAALMKMQADEELRIRLENIGKMNLAEEESLALSEKAITAHVKKTGAIEKMIGQERVAQAQQVFGGLANLASTFGKKSSGVYKTFASAEAIMSTYLAATKALAEGGPFLGPVMAGIVTAMGLANVAKINGALGGQAHDGLTNVPREGTWVLDGGERVVKSNQNADLTAFLENQGSRKSGGGSVAINLGGHRLADLLYEMSESGELEISSRAVRG